MQFKYREKHSTITDWHGKDTSLNTTETSNRPAFHWPKVMAVSMTTFFLFCFVCFFVCLFFCFVFFTPKPLLFVSLFFSFVLSFLLLFFFFKGTSFALSFSRRGARASGAGSPACSPRGGTCLCAW